MMMHAPKPTHPLLLVLHFFCPTLLRSSLWLPHTGVTLRGLSPEVSAHGGYACRCWPDRRSGRSGCRRWSPAGSAAPDDILALRALTEAGLTVTRSCRSAPFPHPRRI
eukprot:350077-Chlamydomonas_euryale.AAC.16